MKKHLHFLFNFFTAIAMAQSNDANTFRFGLKLTPNINWLEPEGKIIVNNGTAFKLGGGLIVEYNLAKNAALASGLQVDGNGGNVKCNNGKTLNELNSNSVSFFYNQLDDKIVPFDTTLSPASNKHFQLNKRSYSVTYITLPITIKLKTNEIGNFVYYGQFGINNSFRWKAKSNDDVQEIKNNSLGTSENIADAIITDDVRFYAASLCMGLGTEMNVSGNTSLNFGLVYNLGFTSFVKDNSDYLERKSVDLVGNKTYSGMPQKINLNTVNILLGVSF